MPAGRPPKSVIKRLEDITFDLEKIEYLAMKGFTDAELADLLGKDERTIRRWKDDEEFMSALKKGKEIADQIIEGALFHRAKGYEHEEEKVFMYKGQIVTHTVIKHYPPETGAAAFWLKNRQPEKWRDKHDLELSDTSLGALLKQDPKERGERIRELKEKLENEKRKKQKRRGA